MNLPEPIKKVVEQLSELPSIGPRQATRLAFYLINQKKASIHVLATDINNLQKIKLCHRCFFIHQNAGELCDICGDISRRKDIIAIVEKETDLISIENTRKFIGTYLIIGPVARTGMLSDAQKIRIEHLKKIIQKELKGQAEEIILAFNPTGNGDFNASLINQELKPLTKKISRLGRGLPTGGEIEFADEETLSEALTRRN